MTALRSLQAPAMLTDKVAIPGTEGDITDRFTMRAIIAKEKGRSHANDDKPNSEDRDVFLHRVRAGHVGNLNRLCCRGRVD